MQKWNFSYFVLGILFVCFFYACRNSKQELSKEQEVFLDFTKYESLYRNQEIYYAWTLGNVDFSERIPEVKISKEKESIKQQIASGIVIDEEFHYKPKLRFPHSIHYQKGEDNRFHVSAKVLIPEKVEEISFREEDIGVKKEVDQLEITLLALEGNEAYFLLKDKSKKIDYSYTQNAEDDKEEDEIEMEEEDSLKYRDSFEFFSGNSLLQTKSSSDSLYYQAGKLQLLVSAARGEILSFDTFTEDFRHFLWYRNMDVAYPEMLPAFQDIQTRYGEEEKSPDYKYFPIFVAKVRSSGIIKNMKLAILSEKAKEESIDLGDLSRNEKEVFRKQNEEFLLKSSLPYENYTAEELEKRIKVTPYSYNPFTRRLSFTLAFPLTANAQAIYDADLSASGIHLDPIEQEDIKIYTDSFDAQEFYTRNQAYFRGVSMYSVPLQSDSENLMGKVYFSYPNFEVNVYTPESLPEGMSFQNNILTVSKDVANSFLMEGEFLAYDKDGNLALMRTLPKEEESRSFQIEYDRPIQEFVLASLLEDSSEGEFFFKIPIEDQKNKIKFKYMDKRGRE